VSARNIDVSIVGSIVGLIVGSTSADIRDSILAEVRLRTIRGLSPIRGIARNPQAVAGDWTCTIDDAAANVRATHDRFTIVANESRERPRATVHVVGAGSRGILELLRSVPPAARNRAKESAAGEDSSVSFNGPELTTELSPRTLRSWGIGHTWKFCCALLDDAL
jgi:hypothetical protein